jgi:acyl dehydratase
MGQMKFTSNRLPSGSWLEAKALRDRWFHAEPKIKQVSGPRDLCWEKWMTQLVVENPQSLKELVGKEIGVTEWFRVTQERIEQFAEATEDRQWIHLDKARAIKESPYGATIAHGFLTLSLISHLMKELVHIRSGVRLAVNYGLNRVRFPAAVRADSRIRARVTLLSLKELADSIEATFGVTIELEGSEKPGCAAEWIVRYYL